MIRSLKDLIKPDLVFRDLMQVDFSKLAGQGIRLVMLDVDNTLALHGSYQADDYAREVIRRIMSAGLSCHLVTNATWHRARQYAKTLDLPLSARANKPSIRAIRRVSRLSAVSIGQCAMIGDQLLTDILAARRAGCLAILVSPRSIHESFGVKFKRILERSILNRGNLL